MKKAQIEAMGLVIIVILLVVIGLIFLVLNINNSGNDNNDKFLTIKANSFMNALYNADLGSETFREVMSSCCAGVDKDCDKIEDFFNSQAGKIEENASLAVNNEYFVGESCSEFVTSSVFSYPASCTTNIRICK